ncbi:hypothetical protein ACFVZW_00375 [Streptomyces sp. NPDC059567]
MRTQATPLGMSDTGAVLQDGPGRPPMVTLGDLDGRAAEQAHVEPWGTGG